MTDAKTFDPSRYLTIDVARKALPHIIDLATDCLTPDHEDWNAVFQVQLCLEQIIKHHAERG